MNQRYATFTSISLIVWRIERIPNKYWIKTIFNRLTGSIPGRPFYFFVDKTEIYRLIYRSQYVIFRHQSFQADFDFLHLYLPIFLPIHRKSTSQAYFT